MWRYWCALTLLAGFQQGVLYNAAAQPANGDVRGYFPQFVLGGGVQSTIVVVNPSAGNPAEGTIEFFDHVGNSWPVVVDSVSYGSGQVPFYLAAGGTRFVAPETGDWPLETGWVRVRAHSPVTATILYGGTAGQAGFPAVSAAMDYVLPVESRADQARTGLAVSVPGGEPVVMKLKLLDAAGKTVPGGTASVDMSQRAQMAAFVDELLPMADLSNFRGSLQIESDAGIALVALHSAPSRLSPLPVYSRGQTSFFSFEGSLQGWQPVVLDVQDGGATADWSIAPSAGRADDGGFSLLFLLDNLTDAGKIWIQKPFLVEPNRKYKVKVSYSFATKDFGQLNLWRIITGVRTTPPQKAEDLVYQGESGHGSPSDIGYVWLDKSYDLEIESGPDGLLYVFVGVWGTWETTRGYYIDGLTVSIRE